MAGEAEGRAREAYLDLNQLFYAIDYPDMFSSLGSDTDDGLVAGTHPAVLEGFAVGLVVVQVAEHDARGAHEEFARLIVAGDLVAFDRDDARFEGWEERAGRAEPDVVCRRRRDYRAGFREACVGALVEVCNLGDCRAEVCPTVSLPDLPLGMLLLQFVGCLPA